MKVTLAGKALKARKVALSKVSSAPHPSDSNHPPQSLKMTWGGNSNVRRTRDEMVPVFLRVHGNQKRLVKQQDIKWSDPERAKEFARRLRLNQVVGEVYTLGQSGPGPRAKINFVQDLIDHRAELVNSDADVYLFSCLSNDLANMKIHDPRVLLVLVDNLFTLAESLPSAKLLLFQQVMPRYENLSCSPEVFMQNAEYVNDMIAVRCDANPICAVAKMGGLVYKNTPEGTKRPVTSEEGFVDGIHPIMDKYVQRIRMAVLENAKVVLGKVDC